MSPRCLPVPSWGRSGDGPLEHYERLGYVVAAAMAVTIFMMARIDTMVRGDARGKPVVEPASSPAGSPAAD